MIAPTRTRFRRGLAAAVAGAVAVTAAPLGAVAHANGLEPIPTEYVCREVPGGFQPFTDIAGDTFRLEIRCLRYGNVASGVTASTYVPRATITREQMASLVANMLDRAKELELPGADLQALPSAPATSRFVDLDPNSPHTAAINRLAAVDIVSGGPGGIPADRFAPGWDVSRGQMATFLANAMRYLLDEPDLAAEDDWFTDDGNSAHQANINLVAELGIAAGYSRTTRFGPGDGMTRSHMAAFIARALAVLEWEDDEVDGLIGPLVPRT